jgi:MoxR-like ATPase
MMNPSVKEAAQRLREAIREATRHLIDRDQLAELMVLGAVAQEHLLIVGPPGTGKSAVVRRVAETLGGSYFEYLLGRFTEPSELFGPVNLSKLRAGLVETDTGGMLPEADIAFLDEVFLGSTAILNTLLGLLNERQFRRGHTRIRCPLRICVGAANGLPEDESLAAFADRFLLHAFVEPVADHCLEDLLAAGWQAARPPVAAKADLACLDVLNAAVDDVDMDAVRPALAHAVRQLRLAGIALSDRRIVRAQRLVAASSALAGRQQASVADLWPLLFAIPHQAAQASARDVLRDVLAQACHPLLQSVTEHAAQTPQARIGRLVDEADRLLLGANGKPPRAHVEALLREIDANFDPARLPAELGERRSKLIGSIHWA